MDTRREDLMQEEREALVHQWASCIDKNARSGALLNGRRIGITDIETVVGPRAGAIELLAGLQTRLLLQALRRNDFSDLRQTIPWDFWGEPQMMFNGRWLRLEAGWPEKLAQTMVRLDSLTRYPTRRDSKFADINGAWRVGLAENGETIWAAVSDENPHFLISGSSGSGKSCCLHNLLVQLLADPENEAILIDGKRGSSLRGCENLPGVIGPVAYSPADVVNALGWGCTEMRRRYEDTAGLWDDAKGWMGKRLLIVVDEFQELTVNDATFADLMHKVSAQGRAAKISVFAATQHARVDSFAHKATRRNFSGKLALKADDPDSARVAVSGNSPRPDLLLGRGDTYLVHNGHPTSRVQGAFVGASDISKLENGGVHRFSRWPDFDAEAIQQNFPTGRAQRFTADERACGLVAAAHGEGRRLMNQRMPGFGAEELGSAKAKRLSKESKETYASLQQHGYELCERNIDNEGATPQPIYADVW